MEDSKPQPDSLTYEPFFGLDEKPFSLNSDQRFVYSSPSYGATLDGLLGGLRRREGLQVLTGEIGTGKTTLCQDVLRDLGRKTYSSIVPDPFASREDLLKMLLIDFGAISVQALTTGALRQSSRTELGYLLSEFLDSLTPDAFAVAIIDEAQNLTLPLIEETRILSDTFGASGRLQIVFVGQPELHAKLKLPEMRQVDQRVCGYHRLGPMSREAVGGYIAHRLHVAGGRRDRVLFSPEVINRLHLRSGGVPRLVNRVCDRALHLAYAQRAEQVDRVTLEAALSEIGSATLSPTWDAIVFAGSHAPEAAPAAAAISDPAPAAVIGSPVAQAATAVEAPALVQGGEDFEKEIDQWVAKDLAPAARVPLNVLFGEVDVLPPPPPPERRSSSRASSRGYVSSRTITNDSPRLETARPRAWVKRIATGVGVLVAATVALVGVAVMTSTEEVTVPPAISAGPATAEPVGAPAATPVAVSHPTDTPATDTLGAPIAAPEAAAPVTAPVATAPIAAAVSDEFLVSVGLFSSRARADQLVDTLTQAGLPALQRPFQLRNREVQQIVLGPFFSRADAAADLQRLKALGGYDDARVVTN